MEQKNLLENNQLEQKIFNDILNTLSTFNLRARYDDYKMEFHKKCTKKFTKKWIIAIEEFRKWIKQMLDR